MNGIGGRTIAEAQENLLYSEFLVWCKFRAKRGSLNQGMRVETAIARLLSFYANFRAGKQTFVMSDFAPHMDIAELTLKEAMDSWA